MLTDAQSIVVDKSAAEVFAFMADPANLDLWSFGTWKTTLFDDGLVEGTAIFDGSKIYLKIDPFEQRWLIDYWIGVNPDVLQPRIFVRITPAEVAGLADNSSVLTMTAIRSSAMVDERWQRLTASHTFELQLIKSLIETGYDHRL